MAKNRDGIGRILSPDILLVDEDHPTLTMLGQGLREAGYTIRIAASGTEALRHCDEQAPELAMLGRRLPDMPCREVAVDLRQRSIPFIFLTGHDDDEVVRESIELEAYSYLHKPLDAGKVVPIINAALHRGAEGKLAKSGSHPAGLSAHTTREVNVAIGVLMERHRLSMDEAFEALRRYARSQRRKMNEVAAHVIRATEDINIPVRISIHGGRKAPPDNSGK